MPLFNFFNKKSEYKISLPVEDRAWIDENFIWFGELFGFGKMGDTYHIDTFYAANGGRFELDHAFKTICEVYETNAEDIIIRVFDDVKEQIWYTIGGTHDTVQGEYYESFEDTKKRFNVKLAKSLFDNPEKLVAVLAHELAHVKLLGEKYIEPGNPDMEPLTDLFVIFSGFGIFSANISLQYSNREISRTGYLNNEYIAYALALRQKMAGGEKKKITDYLQANTKGLFKNYLDYLQETGDTLLTDEKIKETSAKHTLIAKSGRAFDEKDYASAVEANGMLLQIDPKDVGSWNSRGYAYLKMGDWEKAVADFTKGIETDPYFDLFYANRGLCYIKLNKLPQAYADLDSALQMSPNNPWAVRNMGIYHLEKEDTVKAEFYFRLAIDLDPEEELVHYYLGKIHLAQGQTEKAKESFARSAERGEPEGVDALGNIN